MNDKISIIGTVGIVLTDRFGNIKEQRELKNLVVNTGKYLIARRMLDGTAPIATHIAVGAGTVDPDVANVALGSEIARVTLSTHSNTLNVMSHVATFLPGVATGAITEAGIFAYKVSPAENILVSRLKFAVINKPADDTLTINWNLTIV